MKDDRQSMLLRIVDCLHLTDKPCALRKQELLVIVGVVVGCEHNKDRAGHTAVDVVRDYSFKDRSLKDSVELAAVGVEIIGGHRVNFVLLVAYLRIVIRALGDIGDRLASSGRWRATF